MREKTYADALTEATIAAMEENPKVLLLGEGVDDPKGVFGTTLEPYKKWGESRVMDTPLSENSVTGVGIGLAIEGWPTIMVHQRNEFLLLAMDQVINHAAKWSYMFGGGASVPIVMRLLIGRGWGQAAQHSQSFHAMYAHVPGLKVILPSTPYEAKGLLYSAIRDKNPVICIEHRWLYNKKGMVPDHPYEIPIGIANVLAPGKDVTCVAVSYQVYEALEAKEKLKAFGIDLEVIDLRSARPLDKKTIIDSVKKTGRLILTDIAHKTCGVLSEISAFVSEEAFDYLKAPIVRIALPDCPTPCSHVLEQLYYPKVDDIVEAAKLLITGKVKGGYTRNTSFQGEAVPFSGPF